MKSTTLILLITLAGAFLLVRCGPKSDSSNSDSSNDVILGKLVVTDGWARPGGEGQNSAVYLTIQNGTADADTLLGISTNAANSAEVHESVENEDGTTTMRPAGQQTIGEAEQLRFEPGGLHIMLMGLTRNLEVNDSLTVSLEFARVETKELQVPVQMQN